ncbi:MAG: dihydrolipoamide acetyltransferase family protein [Candidatus Igneacidithiobacillus chanchocoensis]
MKQAILMPVLSDTMQTGRLTRWNKSVGDPVHKGEAIAEVETDKAILDVEAFADGFLAGPLAPVDEDIPVRQPIAYLVDNREAALAADDGTATAEKASEAAPAKTGANQAPADTTPRATQVSASQATVPTGKEDASVPVSSPPAGTQIPTSPPSPSAKRNAPTTVPTAGNLPRSAAGASPYARALAQDLGLTIEEIQPGADGQIHASEVLAAALAPRPVDLRYGPPYQISKPSALREAVARNMIAAAATPSFRISTRVDLSPLHEQGKRLRLSFTLALTRACALTVAEDPWFNGVWTPTGWVSRSRVDVGIAVDTGAGLITPVLRDAASRPLAELAEYWRILLGKVKTGRLAPEDYQGASFYVSNLGIFAEVEEFDAIVPVGASAILAVAAPASDGRTQLTLTCDHRGIFGADAARFLQRLTQRLKDPAWLQ